MSVYFDISILQNFVTFILIFFFFGAQLTSVYFDISLLDNFVTFILIFFLCTANVCIFRYLYLAKFCDFYLHFIFLVHN